LLSELVQVSLKTTTMDKKDEIVTATVAELNKGASEVDALFLFEGLKALLKDA
jgi:hypothetical protein